MSELKISIDRIEDGVAFLEFFDRTVMRVPLSELPPSAKEGDILTMTNDGGLAPDEEETLRLRKSNFDLFNSLV